MNTRKPYRQFCSKVLLTLCWGLVATLGLRGFAYCQVNGQTEAVVTPPASGQKSSSTAIVFTEADIATYNVRTLVELLNLIPGVSASGTSVNIQGCSSKSVAVIIDGRPLFNPASGRVYLEGVPIQSIHKVRVVQGVEAAEYGGNTAGGVIVITSKQGKKKYANKIDLAYGVMRTNSSYDRPGETIDTYHFREKGEFNLGTRWKQLGFFINTIYEDSEGERQNNDVSKWTVKGNLDFPLFVDLQGTLAGMYGQREKGNPGKEYYLTPESRSEVTEWGSSLIATNTSFRSRTYISGYLDEVDNPASQLYKELDSLVFGQEVNWHGNWWRFPDITLGGTAEHRRIDSNTYGEQEETIGSLSVNKGLTVTSLPLNLTLGIKFNFYSECQTQYNPQLIIGYKHKPFSVSFQADQGATLPTFDQRYYSSKLRLANPDLGVEKVYNLKLRLCHKLSQIFNYNLVLFYTKTKDLIEYHRFSGYPEGHELYGRAQYQNVDSATSTGVDLNLDYKLGRDMKLDLFYTYLEATNDETGNYLFQKLRHKLKLNIRCQFDNLVLLFMHKYDGSRYDDSMNKWKIEHRYTLDFKADYTWQSINFYFEVTNVFDHRYYVYRGYPGRRRAATLGICYNF